MPCRGRGPTGTILRIYLPTPRHVGSAGSQCRDAQVDEKRAFHCPFTYLRPLSHRPLVNYHPVDAESIS
jgi:hypothetical protein